MTMKRYLLITLALCSMLHAQSADPDTTNTLGARIDTDTEADSFLTALARGTSISATELGYLDGVTSNLQTQLNGKLPLSGGPMSGNIEMNSNDITAAGTVQASRVETGILSAGGDITVPNATGTLALTSDLTPYAPLASPTFTGTVGLPATNVTGTLAMSANNITGTGNISAGSLTVDTNTLFVDAANNRVGVNTASPAVSFEIGSGQIALPALGGYIEWRNSVGNLGSTGIYAANSGDDIAFYTGSVNRLIMKNPNVEITGGIDLGHASDTTLSRSAAGKLAVEGDIVSTLAADETHSGDRNLTGAVTIANQDTSVATSAVNVGMIPNEISELDFTPIPFDPSLLSQSIPDSYVSSNPINASVVLTTSALTGAFGAVSTGTAAPFSPFDYATGAPMRFGDMEATFIFDLATNGVTSDNEFRLLFGVAAHTTTALADDGFALVFYDDAGTDKVKIQSHDGTTLDESTGGATTANPVRKYKLTVNNGVYKLYEKDGSAGQNAFTRWSQIATLTDTGLATNSSGTALNAVAIATADNPPFNVSYIIKNFKFTYGVIE